MTTKNADKNKKSELDEISMSVPWSNYRLDNNSRDNTNRYYGHRRKTAESFVKERSEVHALYIREKEKTRRLYLLISAVLFISSLFVVMFAPDGRETLSYWIGGTLLIFAAGAAGYSRLNAKAPMLEIAATDGNKE